MDDKIETIEGSQIQHGKFNDRIYVMRLYPEQVSHLIPKLDAMARANRYGKIFAKIPAPTWYAFEASGYVQEAIVPNFIRGITDGLFIAKYFSTDRQQAPAFDDQIFTQRTQKDPPNQNRNAPGADHEITTCKPSDAVEMSAVYKLTFKSYPFPIHNPSFLVDMMNRGSRYYCIRFNGSIGAIAAAEIDMAHQNAEMTDFATLPQWRGKGLARRLLICLDNRARDLGLKTAYTIARAASPGMNFVFGHCGYTYAGLLKNNSHISGHIQSMTVWYKPL